MKALRKIAVLTFSALIGVGTAMAGNSERSGQAGASELLVNGWTRSTGWASSNTALVRGLEAMSLNVAGLAEA